MFLWAPSLSFDFQVLPLSPKFFPPLTIRVKDNRQFGSRPTVGQRTISDASKYWINSTKNDAKAAEKLLEPVAGHNRFCLLLVRKLQGVYYRERSGKTWKSQGKFLWILSMNSCASKFLRLRRYFLHFIPHWVVYGLSCSVVFWTNPSLWTPMIFSKI